MNNSEFPIVAIVGRPNVGKSTLFNRFCGKRKAIESAEPGTTRDRLYGDVFWAGKYFVLVDTAGIDKESKDSILKESIKSAKLAISEADLVLFVVDANKGVTNLDIEIAKELHKGKKEVIILGNKSDNEIVSANVEVFKRLGFRKVLPVSAISGRNSGDVLDEIISELKFNKKKIVKDEKKINVAIVGRPNVGKSTLVNAIVGEKRVVVSPISGTTRDSVDVEINYSGNKINLLDTAGMRRSGKIVKDTTESYAVLRSLRAIRDSDVLVYVVQTSEGVVALDLNLIGEAKEAGKSIIFVVNKFDLWPEGERNKIMADFIEDLQEQLNFLPYVPVIFVSAKDNLHINTLMNQIIKVYGQRLIVPEDEILKKILKQAIESQQQIDYIISLRFERNNPAVFKIRTKKGIKPHYSHLRYLENKIRDVYPFYGTPIFIDLE